MKKRLKAIILTAVFSIATAWSAMAAEAPVKTWEEVKNSDDPMELMEYINASSSQINNMDTDYLMNLSLGLGEESISMNTSGNIKIQDATNEAMKYLMTMDMNTLGETETATAFYSDGWYYYDTENGKYKMELDYADALQNAQTTAGLTQNSLSYVKDAVITRDGDRTTIAYTMDGAGMSGLVGQVLSETAGASGQSQGPGQQTIPGVDIKDCHCEYTLDAQGGILKQRIQMNMDLNMDGLVIAYDIYMEMNTKAMGDSVTVTLPSTEGYPTMEEYLQKLLTEAENAA